MKESYQSFPAIFENRECQHGRDADGFKEKDVESLLFGEGSAARDPMGAFHSAFSKPFNILLNQKWLKETIRLMINSQSLADE